MSKFTWNEENTATLESAVAGVEVISQEQQKQLAEEIGTTARSIGSKLRKLGYTNVALASAKPALMTDAEVAELNAILDSAPGQYTYAEIAEALAGGKFSTKQVQGKVLGLQRTEDVKAAPKKEVVRKYSEVEEAKFVEMAHAGASVEDIATALGRNVQQIRGKGLSLFREGKIAAIPAQTVKVGKKAVDVLAGLDFANMTVAELVAATEKTERGIKSILTRRSLACKDYDGAAKHKEPAADTE